MNNNDVNPVPIIFTDLDGTLLDRETYSYEKSIKVLQSVLQSGIPIVFCSSKTRIEQDIYRSELEITDPFIVEDGGAIYIEPGYFSSLDSSKKASDGHLVIEFGAPYRMIRKEIENVRAETGIPLEGYGDMSVLEISRVTGLDPAKAALAAKREYQETIVSSHSVEELNILHEAFSRRGLRLTRGGRFLSVTGEHDKGLAVELLAGLFREEYGLIRILGIGDGYNDLPMLEVVDVPALVQKKPGDWEQLDVPNLVKINGVGPDGWSRFVREQVLN